MSIKTVFTSIRAWFSGLFTKEAKTMTLTATSTTLTVGGTAQLSASYASTYASSDSAVLTVDANGLVTAIAAGSATITAAAIQADVVITSGLDFTVTAVAATEAASQAAGPIAATPVDTDTLKSILTALGHDLDAVWDDAIALAKKAL